MYNMLVDTFSGIQTIMLVEQVSIQALVLIYCIYL